MFAGRFKDGPSGTVVQLTSPGVDNFNMTHPLFQWVAQLNNFPPVVSCAPPRFPYVNQASTSTGPGLFAYSRVLNTQEVFVVFNTASSSQTLPARTLTYPAGTVLVNFTQYQRDLHSDRRLAKHPRLTVPGTNRQKCSLAQFAVGSRLDPVVMSNSPAHWDNQCAGPGRPVVLAVQQTDGTRTSVQNAFKHQPGGRRRVQLVARERHDDVYRLGGRRVWPGRPTSSCVSPTLRWNGVSGKPMFAPYEFEIHHRRDQRSRRDTRRSFPMQTPTNGRVIAGNLALSGQSATGQPPWQSGVSI